MSGRWVVVGTAAVAAVAAAGVLGAWWFLLRDVAEPATVGEAVAAYRQDGAGGRSTIPPGVYVYATDGSERVDALGGTTHRYPRTSTITVSAVPCGVRLRWDVLRGRSTAWTVCTGASGWTERSSHERHTFFGVTDATTYRCNGTPFRPAGDRPGTTFTVDCSTGKATEQGTGRVVRRQTVRVGGTPVPAVQVRTTTSFAGDTTGSATNDFWLARETGLPVRIGMVSRTTTGSLVGDVHYEERVSLRLVSLTPRR
ncbi:MAG: hypothetical protein M5U27_16895 [Gaiella sp.]|nr:hypothetical protein [Gaiella sp.]